MATCLICSKNCENGEGLFRRFATKCGQCNYHYVCLKIHYSTNLHTTKCGCGFRVVVKSWDKTLKKAVHNIISGECSMYAKALDSYWNWPWTVSTQQFESRVGNATRNYNELMYKTSKEFDKVIKTPSVIKIQSRWRGVRVRMQIADPNSYLGKVRLMNEWNNLKFNITC